MSKWSEKAAAALGLLAEDLREPAVAYLLEQAEKYRALKEQVDLGLADAAAGRASRWIFSDFLLQARARENA